MPFPRTGREIRVFGVEHFRGKDVLDIGCGSGRVAFDAARYARRVVGVDPSKDAIRAAQDRAERLGLRNLQFRVGDATELGAGRERFDIAIFSWSLC